MPAACPAWRLGDASMPANSSRNASVEAGPLMLTRFAATAFYAPGVGGPSPSAASMAASASTTRHPL